MDEKNEDVEKNTQKKSTSKWSSMESSSDEGEDDDRDDEGSFMKPEAAASSGNEVSRDKPPMSSLEKLAMKQERGKGVGRDNRNNNRQNIPSNEGINGSGMVFRGKGNSKMKQEDEYTAGGRNKGNNGGNSRERDWGGGGLRGSSGDARNASRVARGEERRDKDRIAGPNRGPAINIPSQAAPSEEKRSDGAKVRY